MGFTSVGALAAATDAGRTHFCSLRKVPSQASTAGWWVDYSMAAGNPFPNYYASSPLVAAVLDPQRGIWHGDSKSPGEKHLTGLGLMTATAGMVGVYTLCDYLLYYPFVDAGDADTQSMDNTVTLPRYTDGAGVQVMAVAVAPTAGSEAFTVTYVNQDGVSRTSPTQTCANAAVPIASIATSQQAVANVAGSPWLTLAAGDTGVRSVSSVTFTNPVGGLLCLVLVKPLLNLAIREVSTMAEVEAVRLRPGAPRVFDGAYLNLIGNCAATVAAGVLTGYATFAWSE